jgi:hypothetical protein
MRLCSFHWCWAYVTGWLPFLDWGFDVEQLWSWSSEAYVVGWLPFLDWGSDLEQLWSWSSEAKTPETSVYIIGAGLVTFQTSLTSMK